jgi:poly-gamma-glutamate synthesis protein (capsule biosynthesis protein)
MLGWAVVLGVATLMAGCAHTPVLVDNSMRPLPVASSGPVPATTPPSSPTPTGSPTTVPTPTPEPVTALLSFAGDCTLGSDVDVHGWANSFDTVVGTDYGYPFANVRDIFADDDFTLVNLETALTTSDQPVPNKTFRFKGSPAYTQILVDGSVESVTIANNHSEDYGPAGLDDTEKALDAAGITWSGYDKTLLFTTKSGLTIGVAGDSRISTTDAGLTADDKARIDSLKAQGADIVVYALHWGIERDYQPTPAQVRFAHQLIDYGVDIVYGSHPHVLQPIEAYGGGFIIYSLGNFSFGGNVNPADKDTVIVRVEATIDAVGGKRMSLRVIPASITSVPVYNDYQPTPVEVGSAAYDRILGKLGLRSDTLG